MAKRTGIVNRGVALLQSGVVLSALPNILMAEFSITAGAAREIAIAVMKKFRGQGAPPKMDEPE